MVDFIYIGLFELQNPQRKREIQKEQFLSTVQFEPVPSAYEEDALPIVPQDLISTISLNSTVFYLTLCYLHGNVTDLEIYFFLYCKIRNRSDSFL